MRYFIQTNGQQAGPYTPQQLYALSQNGSLSPDDFVWQEGSNDFSTYAKLLDQINRNRLYNKETVSEPVESPTPANIEIQTESSSVVSFADQSSSEAIQQWRSRKKKKKLSWWFDRKALVAVIPVLLFILINVVINIPFLNGLLNRGNPVPNSAESDAYLNRGVDYYDQGELDKALTDYNKAIELDPAESLAYLNRGMVYYDQGELDKALIDYNKAIELDPAESLAYSNRGAAYYVQGELDKALTDYNKAIELDPAESLAYIGRGMVYHQQNERFQAVADYDKAIELDPLAGVAYYLRGLAFQQIGDTVKAEIDFTKAKELGYDPLE